jgi:hypothetical protein
MSKIAAFFLVCAVAAAGAWWWSRPSDSQPPGDGPSATQTTGRPPSSRRDPVPVLMGALEPRAPAPEPGTPAKEGPGAHAAGLLESSERARAEGKEAEADRLLCEHLRQADGDGRGAAAGLERARSLLAAGRGTEAESILRLVASSAPRSEPSICATMLVAERLVAQGRLPEAMRWIAASLDSNRDSGFQADLTRALAPLVQRVFFSRETFHDVAFTHVVSKGESLERLVRTWRKERGINLTPGFVSWVNGLGDASRIQPGMRLKVPTGRVRIEISKKAFRLTLLCDDIPLLERRVGVGRDGKTPEGSFVVREKQVNPIWFRPGEAIPYGDPRNPLGTRWLGFEPTERYVGFGIHGTTEPESIGKEMSDGCIRMLNAEVEELFELAPVGAEVTITP